MSDIDALRQRVEAAERSFGLIDERDRNYSARLITLISSIEGQVSGHQAEIAERESRLANLERENGEMRAMLHSLLLAIEDGGKDRIGATVNDMDHRITALLAGEAAEPPQADEGEAEQLDTAEAPSAASDGEDDAEVAEDALLDEVTDQPEESAAEESQPEEIEPEESAPDDGPEVPEAEDSTAETEPEAAAAAPADQVSPDAEASEEDLLAALADPVDGDAAAAVEQEDVPDSDDQEADGGVDLDLSIMEADPPPCEPAATESQGAAADLEGTDVVMAISAPEDSGDGEAGDEEAGDEETDPALAARAEKIAELLSSGDESDPSVKEIIDKVTELAATLESGAKAPEAADGDAAAEMVMEPEAIAETTAA